MGDERMGSGPDRRWGLQVRPSLTARSSWTAKFVSLLILGSVRVAARPEPIASGVSGAWERG